MLAGVSQEERGRYKYYDKELIKSGLEVEGVEQELLVNVYDRKVISLKGLSYKNTVYYNVESLPDGLYNVTQEEKVGIPTFEVKTKQTEASGKWQIEISDIKYEGYINRWQVKYKLKDDENWSISDDLTFNVDKEGTYEIKLVNESIESDIQEFTLEYEVMPDMISGMQPIMIDEEGEWMDVPRVDSEGWYSYEVTEDDDMSDGGTTEGGNSKWANAKLNDNYYVWIPRYAYKVTQDDSNKDEEGNPKENVDVQFITTKVTNENVEEEVGEGYKIPDAFKITENSDEQEGEEQLQEEKEITGIWVGKYETSGTIEEPKIVPDEEPITDATEEDTYETAEKLDTDSVMGYVVGDAEKEAIDYLTRSQYGRNGTEIPGVEADSNTGETEGRSTEENTDDSTKGTTDEESSDMNVDGDELETNLIEEDPGQAVTPTEEPEIKEELKTTTGNKYGIYGIGVKGFRLYLRTK